MVDRLYLPIADGGEPLPVPSLRPFMWSTLVAPKNGARFHFGLPDAVQGFFPEDGIEAGGNPTLENVTGYSQRGQHSVAHPFRGLVPGPLRVSAPVPTRIATVSNAVGLLCFPCLSGW